MKKYLNTEKKRWYERFLTFFGDLKYFKAPFFLVYDPSSYKVRGEDVRDLINVIQPGDVLLRAYDNYVDGLFIPGMFSHVGFYYGESSEAMRKAAGTIIDDNPDKLKRVQQDEFKVGEQMMIHAMADGVFMEDVINFGRCDKLAVLRLPERLQHTDGSGEQIFYKTEFLPGEADIRARLEMGESIGRDEVVAEARKVVLSCLGARYDFRFDFGEDAHNSFSCSELAYYAYRSIDRHIDLKPVKTCIMGICKEGIAPDQFLDSGFKLVWASRSVRDEPEIQALFNRGNNG